MTRRSGEAHMDPGVRCRPGIDLGPLVRGVVVHYLMQHASVGAGHVLEEDQKLLMPVSVLAQPGGLAGGHLQGGEQRGGAVPDGSHECDVRHGLAASATPSGCGSGPGSGISRPHTAVSRSASPCARMAITRAGAARPG
jgi:hypothetical protein